MANENPIAIYANPTPISENINLIFLYFERGIGK